MVVEEFKDMHISHVEHWLELRHMDRNLAKELPAVGSICFDNGLGIAAGFLRQVEGDYLIMDSLITNPLMPASKRNDALDLVVEDLIDQAKKMDKMKIFANSVDENTLKRGKRFGFNVLPNIVVVLNLKKEGN